MRVLGQWDGQPTQQLGREHALEVRLEFHEFVVARVDQRLVFHGPVSTEKAQPLGGALDGLSHLHGRAMREGQRGFDHTGDHGLSSLFTQQAKTQNNSPP